MHRGDASRRRKRLKQTALAMSFFGAVAFLLGNRKPAAPEAEAALVPSKSSSSTFNINIRTNGNLTAELDSTRGELELMKAQMARANQVIGYSSQYKIAADLAGQIVDVANAEGIDPELAFRLVRLESDFNPRATSPVGALGLTQVMPSTAKYYVKGVTAEKLFDPQTNLRVGFRYLHGLVKEYHGDVKLALLVYNRGPAAVAKSKAQGDNPSNGYDRIVTRGYRGKGTSE